MRVARFGFPRFSRLRSTVPLALLLTVFAATAAPAADEIAWAESWKDAVAEAKARGAKILVVLVMDNEDANDQQKDVYRQDKGVAKAAGKFVCLFACRDRDHGEEKVRVGGEQVSRCRVAKTIPCRVHQAVEGFVVGRFGSVFIDAEGNVRTPVQFLVDVEGNVLETFAVGSVETGFDPVAGPALAVELETAARKHGAGLDRSELVQYERELTAADELMKKEKYARAAAKYHEIVEGSPEGLAMRERAKEKLAEIGRIGLAGVEEGRTLVKAKELTKALARLERVTKEFPHTSAAEEAAKAIAAIETSPEMQKRMRDRAAKAAAEKLLASAKKAEKSGKWARALKAYDECAKEHGALPAGEAAKKRAGEIRADEELMAKVREAAAAKDCRRWLGMARNFIKNGMGDKAKGYLQKVIDEYPGTSFADEAKKMLAEL